MEQYHAAGLRRLMKGDNPMNDHTMHPDSNDLAADIADLGESLYEFHLRLHDISARQLWHGASREQRMTGLLIEGTDNDLVELYRARPRYRNT
jgi:hypothetical protein